MNAARTFKTILPDKRVTVRDAEPSAAMTALTAVEKASDGAAGVDNITLNFVMRTRARAEAKSGDAKKARATLDSMPKVFKARGVKAEVVEKVRQQADAAKHVGGAERRERLAAPARPPVLEPHAGQASHQVELRGPHVAHLDRVRHDVAVLELVVPAAEVLRDRVVDVVRHAVGVGSPRQHGLPERQPLELRHARLDHEPPAGSQMRGGVLEARHLAVLRDQVEDRVEHEVDERELAVDARGRHVPDDGLDPVGAGLLAQAIQHRLRVVHAGDPDSFGERQRDPAGPDGELQRGAVAGELGERVHRRPDHGRIEHLPRVPVVPRGDALAEVPLFRHGPQCFMRSVS